MKKAAAGCSSIAARLHGRAGSRCGDAECAAAAAARPQWAALPLPLQRLSPHSLSRRVRDLLTGDLVAHPDLPVDPDPEPELPAPETPPVIESTTGGCRPADAAAAWDGRHELEDLAGIVDVLTDVNRRAAELVKGRL